MWHYKVFVWLAGFCLLLASCTDSSRYIQALPKDAALVSSINLAGLVEKAGGQDDESQRAWIGRAKKALGDLGNLNALVDKMLNEPSASGLALNDRLYFFVGAHSSLAGVLVRVSDEGKVGDLLERLGEQHLCEPLREGEGCRWTTAGKFLLAYSDMAFLMMTHPRGGNPADLRHQAGRLLRQDESEGFSSSSEYRQMLAASGDVVAFASLNVLPQTYTTSLMMGLSAELNPQDVKLLASVDFQQGKAVIDVQASAVSEAMDRQFRKIREAGGMLKGTFLEAFPANTGACVSVNVDGKKVYDLLNEIPLVSRKFQHSMVPLDFRAIFESIDGDVTLAFPHPSLSQGFIAYAEVTNRDFLQTVEDLKPLLAMTGGQARLTNQGTDAYEFQAADGTLLGWKPGPVMLWFGVKDHRLYVTNNETLIGKKVLGLSLRDAKWKNRVDGKCFLAALNLREVVKGGNYAVVDSPDGQHIHAEWVMDKQDRNILQQLLHLIGF